MDAHQFLSSAILWRVIHLGLSFFLRPKKCNPRLPGSSLLFFPLEVITIMTHSFAFSKADKCKNGSKYIRILSGEDTQYFLPIDSTCHNWIKVKVESMLSLILLLFWVSGIIDLEAMMSLCFTELTCQGVQDEVCLIFSVSLKKEKNIWICIPPVFKCKWMAA